MSVYDLETVHAPRLTGMPLRAMARALENPVVRSIAMVKLLADAGFDKWRAKVVDEPPTGMPLVRPAVRPKAVGLDMREMPPEPVVRALPTVRDHAASYRNGTSTPVEVAQKVLAAIRAADGGPDPLHLFIAVHEDDVLEQAKASAERINAGKARSALDGVPVAIKDEVDQAGYPTTVGTKFLGDKPAVSDATTVARLRAAGALLIGKTNMHEIGINPDGQNVHYGACKNPWNPAHDTGGSSSGSAAAVAAGLCPVALGADGGGSIRIPAALCGVVGLKPTYGRISEYGAAPLCWSVAHLGPIGATVADVAWAYYAMAGKDDRDPNTRAQPRVSMEGWDRTGLSGLTIGMFPEWFKDAEPEVVSACEAMLRVFENAGASVKEIRIPDMGGAQMAHAATILSEMAAAMGDNLDRLSDFGPAVRINLCVGMALTARDYVDAQRWRTHALATYKDIFREVDLVATPATAATAPMIPPGGDSGGWSDLAATAEAMRYVVPGNFCGMPAISFPAGYDKKGLPIGMQVMGRWWDEHVLLGVASVAERNMERRTPPVHFDVLR